MRTKDDPCPNCNTALTKVEAPTDAQRKTASLPDSRGISPTLDTAPADTIEEHGNLYRCHKCGFEQRYKTEAFKAPRPA